MAGVGLLEGMARCDMEALLETIRDSYRPGSLDRLTAAEPPWREALDRAEADVGALYEALREADQTLARWRQALVELHRLWLRTRDVLPAPDRLNDEDDAGPSALEEVA